MFLVRIRAKPNNPSAEPNSQAAAGMGTTEIE
jgi:hypothetical protein